MASALGLGQNSKKFFSLNRTVLCLHENKTVFYTGPKLDLGGRGKEKKQPSSPERH